MSAQLPLSIDTHAHVFHRGLPFIAARRFTPTYDAPREAYFAQLDANGSTHGVLVALSILGNDNSYLLETLRSAPSRLRGIVGIDPATDLPNFDAFAEAGVVGVRVNLTGGLPVPDFSAGAWGEAVAECVRRGWQVEINDRAERLDLSIEPLLAAGANVVIDHFGMPDRLLGEADPGLKRLIGYAGTRKVWVKLSGDFRFGAAVADRVAPRLLDAFGPQRLMWASDWPFTQHESTQRYAEQRAALDRWIPDAQARKIILDDTPRALFRF